MPGLFGSRDKTSTLCMLVAELIARALNYGSESGPFGLWLFGILKLLWVKYYLPKEGLPSYILADPGLRGTWPWL